METNMIKGIAAMIRKMLKKTVESGLSVQAALKRVMAKLLGECMMSKQETSYLILSLPMVLCSHEFFRVNLDVESTEIDIASTNNNTVTNDNEVNNVENNNVSSIAMKSIIDLYGSRIVRSNWINDQVYDNNLSELEGMNLRDFCSNFKVGSYKEY